MSLIGGFLGLMLDKYLKDYFENFSFSNMETKGFLRDITFKDLIFSKKILEKMSSPISLKFGMLG
jgi:hypothetical protein